MNCEPIQHSSSGVVLTIHAQPGARRTAYDGQHGDALKFRVAAPPVDGAANEALLRHLADLCKVARSAVRLESGQTGRRKRISIQGVTAEATRAALDAAKLVAALVLLSLTACAGPKPILYPNAYLNKVGPDVMERDIEQCRALAENAGASPGEERAAHAAKNAAVGGVVGAAAGAVGGAIVGAAGSGSAVGAASGVVWGLLGSFFQKPDPGEAYKNFVNRCLAERGYEPMGWD